jgi:hypothetical protein
MAYQAPPRSRKKGMGILSGVLLARLIPFVVLPICGITTCVACAKVRTDKPSDDASRAADGANQPPVSLPQPIGLSGTPAPPPTPEVVQTGPRSLWDAYQKNEVGADNSFRGKRLRLGGVVHDVKKDAFNSIVVDIAATVATPGGALHGPGTITCRFGDEWSQQIGAIERGQLLGLECNGRGMTLGTPQLDDCSVTWTQPKDLEPFAAVLGPSYELCLLAPEDIARVRKILVDGKLVDGGPLSARKRGELAQVDGVRQAASDALSKAGVDPLPCEHPAIWIFKGCDGMGQGTAPQCSSELVKLTWKHIHVQK